MSFTHGEEKRGGVLAADMLSSAEAETNSSISSKFERPSDSCTRSASWAESSGMPLSIASRCDLEEPFQRGETPAVRNGHVSWFSRPLNNFSLLCGDRLLEALRSVPAVKNEIGTVPSTSAGLELLIELELIKQLFYRWSIRCAYREECNANRNCNNMWAIAECNYNHRQRKKSFVKVKSTTDEVSNLSMGWNKQMAHQRFPYGQHAAKLWNLSQSFVLKFHIWVSGLSLSSEVACAKSQYGWNGQLHPEAHCSVNALGLIVTYKCVPRKKRSVRHFSSSVISSSKDDSEECTGESREIGALLKIAETSLVGPFFWISALGIIEVEAEVDRGMNATVSTDSTHLGRVEGDSAEIFEIWMLDCAIPWPEMFVFRHGRLWLICCNRKLQKIKQLALTMHSCLIASLVRLPWLLTLNGATSWMQLECACKE